jgi:hypothetical protein
MNFFAGMLLLLMIEIMHFGRLCSTTTMFSLSVDCIIVNILLYVLMGSTGHCQALWMVIFMVTSPKK